MPFDTAFGMDEIFRAALCIVFAGFEGQRFNWSTWEFERPQA